MWNMNIILSSTLISILVGAACGLQCYKCSRQHWNWDDCTTVIEQCKNFQDACVSYTEFTLPTYWEPRGERHHQISKGCDTMQACETRQTALDMATCTRSPYDNWACVECCTGDLCNYFITLGSSSLHAKVWTVLLVALVTALYVFKT